MKLVRTVTVYQIRKIDLVWFASIRVPFSKRAGRDPLSAASNRSYRPNSMGSHICIGWRCKWRWNHLGDVRRKEFAGDQLSRGDRISKPCLRFGTAQQMIASVPKGEDPDTEQFNAILLPFYKLQSPGLLEGTRFVNCIKKVQ